MTQRTKAVFKFLLDVVELYIPMISFLAIFICFMLQIVSRYFFTPLMWPEELALHAFIWAALFGALYAKRQEALVSFTMIYDRMGDRGKAVLRVVGGILLVAAFAISFKPSLDYVLFMSYKRTSVLLIPMNVISSAYLVFLVDIVIRYVVDIVRDVRFLVTRRPA